MIKQIISEEEVSHYVSYSEFVTFVASNCGIEDVDKMWNYAEKITTNIVSDTVVHVNIDSLKTETLMEKRGFVKEKEWLLKFFEAHPFMKKIAIAFED